MPYCSAMAWNFAGNELSLLNLQIVYLQWQLRNTRNTSLKLDRLCQVGFISSLLSDVSGQLKATFACWLFRPWSDATCRLWSP
jgi:hypothetical protein